MPLSLRWSTRPKARRRDRTMFPLPHIKKISQRFCAKFRRGGSHFIAETWLKRNTGFVHFHVTIIPS
jgi:hypothetical protein